MTRTVRICTSGDCGGECYRCRVTALTAERDEARGQVAALMEAVQKAAKAA